MVDKRSTPLCKYLWHKDSYDGELYGTDLPTEWNQVVVICYPDLVFGFFVVVYQAGYRP